MDVSALRAGDKVQTVEGAVVEVVKESKDGRWVLVRYVAGTEDPQLIGTEDLCDEGELVRIASS